MIKIFDPIALDPHDLLPRLDGAKMVFAVALKNVLPKAEPLASTHEGFTFRALFSWQGALPPLFLTLMHEEMRRIKKEGIPFKGQEMLRSNAASFLRHHGFREKAEVLEEGNEEVIPLIRLKDYLDEPFSHKTLDDTTEIGVVQLLAIGEVVEGMFEVIGTAFDDDKEAKAFLKLYKEEMKRGEKDKSIENGLITSAEAIEKRDRLISTAREAWKGFYFQEVGLLEELDEESLAKIGILYPKGVFWTTHQKDEAMLFCPKGRENTEMHHLERFVSSWIEKTAFSPYEQMEEKGKIKWFLIDRIGVRHEGPTIEWNKKLGLIQASLIGHLESWLSV